MGRGRNSWSPALLLCGLLALVPSFARAQDAAAREARALFEQAERRFQAEQYEAALALYQQAYAHKPLPGFHFNIGQCYRHLGRYDEALRHFRLYLASSSNPRHRQAAEELIALSERERDQQQPPQSAPASAPTAEVVTSAPATASAPAPAAEPPPRARRFRPIHFWTAAGLSSALLLTAGITSIMALQKSIEFNDPDTDYNKLAALQSAGVTLRTTSIVTLILGALGAAGTTWLYFRTDFGAPRAALVATPLVGGGAALVATGSF